MFRIIRFSLSYMFSKSFRNSYDIMLDNYMNMSNQFITLHNKCNRYFSLYEESTLYKDNQLLIEFDKTLVNANNRIKELENLLVINNIEVQN